MILSCLFVSNFRMYNLMIAIVELQELELQDLKRIF